jgi:hypothetical protein
MAVPHLRRLRHVPRLGAVGNAKAVRDDGRDEMKVIQVTHEAQVKGHHITFIDDSPEAAATTVCDRFGQEVDTVYTLGRRVFVPVTVTPEQFWRAMSNGV